MKKLILTEGPAGLSVLTLRSGPVTTGASWTIDTGRKALALNGRLHTVTKKLWVFGNITDGATYACDYHEMRLMLTELFGPSDQDPKQIEAAKEGKVPVREPIWPQIVAGVAYCTLVVAWGIAKALVILTVLPLIIRFFSKPK